MPGAARVGRHVGTCDGGAVGADDQERVGATAGRLAPVRCRHRPLWARCPFPHLSAPVTSLMRT